MAKLIPCTIESCGECRLKIHKTDVIRAGFYCSVTGSWIKRLNYINADCPFDEVEEKPEESEND